MSLNYLNDTRNPGSHNKIGASEANIPTMDLDQRGHQILNVNESLEVQKRHAEHNLQHSHCYKAFAIINFIGGVITLIAGVFTIVYFVILRQDVYSLGIDYNFSFLDRFIVLSIHWIFNFIAAMLAVVAIMNRSYGCFKAFVLFQFVNIILLIVGSAFLANYRINNYRGRNYTYIDIVLYVELGLLIWFLLTLIPTCYLWSPLSTYSHVGKKIDQASQGK